MRTAAAFALPVSAKSEAWVGAEAGIDSWGVSNGNWQAHDLLRLRRLPASNGEPDWVRAAFARAPFAVVRRALAAPGFIAVGMRGSGRAQRYGTWANAADIEAAIRPEDLAACIPADPARRALPAFTLLDALRREAQLLRTFTWGPTGSAGFELATITPTVTMASDLDLLIRTPQKISKESAAQMLTELATHAQRAGIRIDTQLETPAGGVALAEWAAGKARVMVRHAQGPRLLADPWDLSTVQARFQTPTPTPTPTQP